jgi:hypothetical protein
MELGVLDYVAVGSQRVAQKVRLAILMFVFEALLVALSLAFSILNRDVIVAENRRIKQTSLELLHLLMQNLPCSDKIMPYLAGPWPWPLVTKGVPASP